ncbi:MAG: hypothetical protein AAFO15_02465 [Pseudomonadota bacterium]
MYKNKIEWAIISFPILNIAIIFNGKQVSYNVNSINGYPALNLNRGNLNAIDIIIHFEYIKYLNSNTLITRNSNSVLLLLILNKITSGIISVQNNTILNNLITVICSYANIPFEKKEKYIIASTPNNNISK